MNVITQAAIRHYFPVVWQARYLIAAELDEITRLSEEKSAAASAAAAARARAWRILRHTRPTAQH